MCNFPVYDYARIQRVTADLFLWQGLRFVPFGLTYLIVAAGFNPWWPVPDRWIAATLVGGLLVSSVAFWAISAYYQRAFGQVRGLSGLHRRREGIKWLIVYPALGASLMVDGVLRPNIFVSGLVWAAAIVAYWWSTGRGRPHYLVGAALLAIFSVLPALGLLTGVRPLFSAFFALLGVLAIMSGILDHLELAHLLRPVQRERHEHAV